MITPVKVYNNLVRKKTDFKTITPGEVKFYSCGPTTYDFLHVGNGMALVIGDMIHRVFKALGYKVTFVRNFTDVDDKIINKAKEHNVDPLVHSARFVDECKKDMDSIGMLPATHTPKVSETMKEIIVMIETLIKKGFAYNADGEVLYHVPLFKEYGKLSKKDLESLQHGIRVETEAHKKHPSDFVLWKPAKVGEPAWDSPWGKGRPGWHIECSAMAKKFLGETIDIHHGGNDLMFPHHENEIAQSEAANGKAFSNHWCHNEMLNFGSDKMSKSLGNVITIRQFIESFGGPVFRQIILSSHYRSRLEWNDSVIERAIRDCERIHQFMLNFNLLKKSKDGVAFDFVSGVVDKMKYELANDFNLPGALAHFFSLIRDFNRDVFSKQDLVVSEAFYQETLGVIEFFKLGTGLIHDAPQTVLSKLGQAKSCLKGTSSALTEDDIQKLLQERLSARASKNWARADEIRKMLDADGVAIKDNPDGTTSWSRK